MKDRRVIKSSQRGFSKGKSCLTNLITFYNGYLTKPSTGLVDEGGAVDIVYLGFSQAVDTVSHNMLIEKLMKYGLDKQADVATQEKNQYNQRHHEREIVEKLGSMTFRPPSS
ncbi:hypothetical protein QYF61_012951 [Mycteria americana]|uniref:Rna-directed dna polymerase from mobile element jockey-like n=1 Tax=Mycteria americana TaxID=33587 RepID=A0AAN7RV96_MYCAM|nr:hypothetical protein QYF61_012951 [Mycteria americana]